MAEQEVVNLNMLLLNQASRSAGAPTMVETRVLVEVECIDEDSLVMTREEELEVTNPRPGACNAMSNLSFLFDLT
ncbi:hypothetical protein Bca101_010591 [Brassica carinata]